MTASLRIAVSTVAFTLSSLLLSGCAPRIARSGDVASGGPGAGTPQPSPVNPQPSVPPQFPEVAEAEWTIEKPLVGRERKCENGKIAIFPCQEVDLLAFLPVTAIGGRSNVNDIWGWTDPMTGREFVLLGLPQGTSFVEITDPVNPRYLGILPGHIAGAGQRSIKVYQHHAFVTAEGRGVQGVQVFDLTQLRDVRNAPLVFQETGHYAGIESVHNIVIDTAAGFAYTVGNGKGPAGCDGGLHMLDIRVPLKPAFVGCYPEPMVGKSDGYVHDAQCVIYRGPDQQYRGRQICLNAAIKGLGIVDVTDKQHPKRIGVGTYPRMGVTHQGWLTDDHRYFFLGDEGDEGNGRMTRTLIFDLNHLDDPVLAKEFFGTTPAIDHNMYPRGHYMYQAHYDAGLRILDIADPLNPKEVAYFDTDIFGRGKVFWFSGAWGTYPYFRNGVVAVSSMGDGLFILRYRPKGVSR